MRLRRSTAVLILACLGALPSVPRPAAAQDAPQQPPPAPAPAERRGGDSPRAGTAPAPAESALAPDVAQRRKMVWDRTRERVQRLKQRLDPADPDARRGPRPPDPALRPAPAWEKAPYLGVAASPAPPALRRHLQLKPGVGLVIDSVDPSSPAEEAGLKQYDVLQKLDEQLLIDVYQFLVLVRTLEPGKEVKLTLVRDGRPIVLPIKPVERALPPLEDFGFVPSPPGGDAPRSEDPPAEPEVRWTRPAPDLPPVPALPPSGGGPYSVNVTDGLHALSITSFGGEPHRCLVAKDRGGKVVFDGVVDLPGDYGKLPAEVAEIVKRLDRDGSLPPDAGPDGKGLPPGALAGRAARAGARAGAKAAAGVEAVGGPAAGLGVEAAARKAQADASEESGAIRREDLVTVSISDLQGPGVETVTAVRVGPGGTIALPFIGPLTAAGRTEAELEVAIAKAYADAELIAEAQVSVQVSDRPSGDAQPAEGRAEEGPAEPR